MSERSLIYLDNNATTAVAPEVFEAMVPYLTDHYGNPSSAYSFGRQVRRAIDVAREQFADLIQADPQEIIFTSCGTESDNTAIQTALAVTRKKHIVTTQVEHSAVLHLAEHLEHKGVGISWIPVRSDGTIDVAEVEAAIRPDTAIVSIMWANNETGVLSPIQEIAALCKARGILFHTDAVQTPGKIALDMNAVPADFVAFSGHKLHAPKGVGVLFARKKGKYTSWMIGGGQEKGRRAGTENVASIVGLGVAATLAKKHLEHERTIGKALRDRFEKAILKSIPGSRVNGHLDLRLPNTSNICFGDIEAEALLNGLDAHGICASSGSACTTGSIEPSHVLSAMGLTELEARSSLRFSFSRYNTEAEIDKALAILPEQVRELRATIPA